MGRHKTLQQKKLADLRRQKFIYTLENKSSTDLVLDKILPSVTAPADKPYASNTIAISNYSYIKRDILKTLLLTASIIGFQIVLFFILKNHILILPMVKY